MNGPDDGGRRALLKGGVASGLLLALGLPGPGAAAQSIGGTVPLGAFLRIGTDDLVTVIAPTHEMGQGATSALAVIVADELGADWSRLSLAHPSLDAAYNFPGTQIQYTAGSAMVRRWNLPLRRSAAAARHMLIDAASRQWSVPAEACRAEGGRVLHPASGRSASFGSLALAASKVPPPENPVLRTGSTLIGTRMPRLDIPSKVDGTATFGADVRLPGMVYAAIRQSPVFGAKLASVNADAVTGRRGVIEVVRLPDAVVVVADSWWRAQGALEALDVRFMSTPQGKLTTKGIAESQRIQLDSPFAVTAIQTGDVSPAMEGGEVLTADYRVPYLYHATLETMTCTVRLSDDKLEYWVPTQFPTAVADAGTRLTGLPRSKIEVNLTQMGGAFGRKFEVDYVEQATLIAKAVKRPVQLIWSREEDVQHGRYRPAMTARLSAVVKEGDLQAVSLRIVGPSIAEFRPGGVPFNAGYDFRAALGIASETGQAPGKLQHYSAPNFLTEIIYQPAHVPCGSWRSVGASENGFFIESFIDELAAKAGQDPYQFRRHLLRESPRAMAVLDKAAEEAGWGKPLPPGRFRGIAFTECVGSLISQVVEISMEQGQVKVHRVVCAIDCGTALCPDNVRAQTEGCIVMGLSAALGEEITIKDGRVQESNLSDYPVLGLAATPRIDVHIIDSGHALGGVGEAALPATAPALCNAVFAASGKRARSLPLRTAT